MPTYYVKVRRGTTVVRRGTTWYAVPVNPPQRLELYPLGDSAGLCTVATARLSSVVPVVVITCLVYICIIILCILIQKYIAK